MSKSKNASPQVLMLGFLASHNGTTMKGIISALNSGVLMGTAKARVQKEEINTFLNLLRKIQEGKINL